MSTHIRTDNGTFECGIGPELPEGDKWVYESEYGLYRLVDCEGCGGKKTQIGTPLSELDGRNGGNAAWRAISASWGYP